MSLRTRALFSRSASLAVALLLSAGLLQSLAIVPAAAASPTLWFGGGPGFTSYTDGSEEDPQFTYENLDPGYGQREYQFVTIAAADATVSVPYVYSGYHGESFQAFLDGFIGPEPLPSNSFELEFINFGGPSGPFIFSGTATFDVLAGETYGFNFGGTVSDGTVDPPVLRGSLSLPFTPYTDVDVVDSNTSWTTAAELPTGADGVQGVLSAQGESRWYKFPVQPDSQVQVDLTGLAENYDLTLFRDIGQAFTTLTSPDDLPRLGAEFAADAYSPSIYSPSIYSPSIYSPSIYSPSIYSPSIYSPSIYSPSIYSPSIYSPSIYSPSIYSPSIYSPSIYSPSIYSPSDAFVEAFASAQTRSLTGVSAREGSAQESIRAATWNNTGSFYVRVNGRGGSFSDTPFTLTLTVSGGPCADVTLDPMTSLPTVPITPGATTVILTDSARLGLSGVGAESFTARLQDLADATDGAVVDVAASERVRALNVQADQNTSCYYAKNLVAEAIRDVVKGYRAAGTVQYVVLAGGDGVLPFFRYPDNAGLGAERDYVPPVDDATASQASLRSNTVLGQDAYGSLVDLAVKGSVLPVPDLAVGRLVETAPEIEAQVDDYLALTGGTLPDPESSLVTGYDFLTSAADVMQEQFSRGMVDGQADTLITDQGVPTDETTENGTPTRDKSWTADDLRDALSEHHDLVFLAGHFSANSTLAADYRTSVLTTELAANPELFAGSLVMSPGCHSGYNLLDADGIPGLTEGLDWAQLMAQQGATLIAGTGYQYADTDFLAYGAELYTHVGEQLRAGTAGTPVAVGAALMAAKQDYLAGVGTLSGIDQKTIIQTTLFGLPMTGLDLDGRTGTPPAGTDVPTAPVPEGTPGGQLGLRTATLEPTFATAVQTRPVLDLQGNPTGDTFRWLTGADGVSYAPAVPARPEQILDVTPDVGTLRGVGFRSGTYTDTSGVTPLTGAPATEQNGIHTSFSSPAFFPQQIFSINYFGALSGSGDGRTRLVVGPAQHRSDSGAGLTVTERTYSAVGLTLFSSDNIATYGQNTPALAAPPSISQVGSQVGDTGVVVSAHVTGDLSAGIQQVWVTYTAEAGVLHGDWASVDLTQDQFDSTLWTGTIPLPAGQDAADVRFLFQAVNGVGLVGVDNNFGLGYTPGVPVGTTPPGALSTSLELGELPASEPYGGSLPLSATLSGAPSGSPVTFSLGAGSVVGLTDTTGTATAELPLREQVGRYTVTASYAGDATYAPSSDAQFDFQITRAATTLTFDAPRGAVPVTGAPSGSVILRSGEDPLRQKAVRLSITDAAGDEVAVLSRLTDLDGRASLVGDGTILPPGRLFITASFGVAAPGTVVDPSYGASTATRRFVVPGLPVLDLPGDITRTTANPDGRRVRYTATAEDGMGRTVPVTCAPPSGARFPIGTTTVSCAATNRAGETTTGDFDVTVVLR